MILLLCFVGVISGCGGTEMVFNPIIVPAAEPPTVDGKLSTGEWDAAIVKTFTDGSELLFMHSDGYLYLGIRANKPGMIAGNVLIQRGDEIAILHSSAALGTAIYQRGEQSWQQKQNFTWQCRDTSNSDAANEERRAFLRQEGWVAANSRMGTPSELEYRVEITEEKLHMAVNIIRASNPSEKIPWPPNLDDDSIKPTPGGLPEILSFSLEQWGLLEVSK
jgi:hypothetical protein